MLILPAQVPGLLDGAKILPGTAQQRHRRQRDDRRTDRQTDVHTRAMPCTALPLNTPLVAQYFILHLVLCFCLLIY